ncbi:MAG TPA: DUF2092 domain-containing protein [Candidatus Polarisedimenticolaceae bacterium]|nr:DUF2092 domain-containing protein [Candidatus Polarisedimenticolaceae bacterium]
MPMPSIRLISVTLLAVAALVPVAPAGAQDSSDPAARDILSRVQKTYADARSYEDDGTIAITYTLHERTVLTTSKTFSTAYERPGRFRFICQGDPRQQDERYLIWRDGEKMGHWSSRQPIFVTDQSFNYAVTLAARPAISDRASHTVASLLMPTEVFGYGLDTMTELKRLDDGTLDGDVCYRIEGEAPGIDRIIWVAQSTQLIRRIEERSHNSQTETERITTYHPVLGGDVEETRLALPEFAAR